MNFTNTDRVGLRVYEFLHLMRNFPMEPQLDLQVYYQIEPIKTKIHQEIKK
jgi:hypothetical protein